MLFLSLNYCRNAYAKDYNIIIKLFFKEVVNVFNNIALQYDYCISYD